MRRPASFNFAAYKPFNVNLLQPVEKICQKMGMTAWKMQFISKLENIFNVQNILKISALDVKYYRKPICEHSILFFVECMT